MFEQGAIPFHFSFFPPTYFFILHWVPPVRYVASCSSPGESLEDVTFELDLENSVVGGGRGKKRPILV